MRNFIIILGAAVLLNLVDGVKFEEVDVYDDYEVEERSKSEAIELEIERPVYDLKDAPNLFIKFVDDYNKKYKSEEDYKQHYSNFVKNLEEINVNNREGRGSVSDINMFADYSDDELAKLTG